MKNIKNIFALQILFLILNSCQTASVKEEKFNNKIISLYGNNKLFNCNIIKQKKNNYLTCVVELPQSASHDLDQVARTKAQRIISEYINGAQVVANTLIVTEETKKIRSSNLDSSNVLAESNEYVTKMIDEIKTNSESFINEIQCLAKIKSQDNRKYAYIFMKKIN